jgi:hypothetical protein
MHSSFPHQARRDRAPSELHRTGERDKRVGAIEESVTVSAQSPLVDVQQAVTQQVLPQALLDAVPTGGWNIQSVGATLVGVTDSQPEVGGA